jgi:hypothetical protein
MSGRNHSNRLYEIDYVAKVPSNRVLSLYGKDGKLEHVIKQTRLVLRKVCIQTMTIDKALDAVMEFDEDFVRLFAYKVVDTGTVVFVSERDL